MKKFIVKRVLPTIQKNLDVTLSVDKVDGAITYFVQIKLFDFVLYTRDGVEPLRDGR